MNGRYYPNPTFPSVNQNSIPNFENDNTDSLIQEDNRNVFYDEKKSYLENIIRLNKGRKVTVFASFANSNEWKDKKFEGNIEEALRDFLILSNPQSGEWYLIPFIYLDYVVFNEKINYHFN